MKHFCQKLKYSFKEYMLIVGKTRIIRRYISALPLIFLVQSICFIVSPNHFPIILLLFSFVCYPFAVTLYDIVKCCISYIFFPDDFYHGRPLNQDVEFVFIFPYIFYWIIRSLPLFLFSPLLAIILLILLSFPNISNKFHR